MYSELECGICCWTYNAGRRCPRELQCKHSFCESCLVALSRTQRGSEEARPTADTPTIVCPLCRHTTSISGEGRVRAELRVDESVLERLLAAGVLDREEDEPEEEEEQDAGQVQDGCGDSEQGSAADSPAEDSDSLDGTRRGKIWRSCGKVWRKICGKKRRENFMTNDDMRNFAMMACYMF
ncbi:RING finger protein 227 [Symphorus nematophorus]